MRSPYENLPPHAFWKPCREAVDFRIRDLYRPKFRLRPGQRIATAGSCFAQNIGKYLRGSDLALVDVEPAPDAMPDDVAARFGYGLYSARYGNVYTARQLRQLLDDCREATVHDGAIWRSNGRWFDGLRPNVEPEGFADARECAAHRRDHLRRVRSIFAKADAFVFTLGLTEAWLDAETGVVFPTVPGAVAGTFDPARHRFVNFGLADTLEDLAAAIASMHALAPELRIILTVSPVPLTATAGGLHVLQATTYSKSVLRAVAGEMAASDPRIDYFPSYEMITGAPFAVRSYAPNLRSVTPEAVQRVMSVFFAAQDGLEGVPAPVARHRAPDEGNDDADDANCEEAMLEAFAPR